MSDNEFIAEFMGFALYKDDGEIRIYNVPEGEDLKYKAFKLSHVKFAYDTSWDWLMPVVEKMVDIGLSKTEPDDVVSMVEKFSGTSIICPRQGVYERVVEFIKWYNNQKQ